MDITYIPPQRQSILLLYSLIIGYSSGLICDIARFPAFILNDLLHNKNKLCIIINIMFDILISIVNIILIIVFIYAVNAGMIRYFMLLSTLIGIILYKISLGKLTKILAEAISKAVIKSERLVINTISNLIRPIISKTRDNMVIHGIRKKIVSAYRR